MTERTEDRPRPTVHIGSGDPCRRCMLLAFADEIRPETVMPLHPTRARNSQAQDGSGQCCADCASADLLTRMSVPTFEMARIAVGNDRQEQLRLPGIPMGLVRAGFVQSCAPGDFDRHLNWLREHGIEYVLNEDEDD